MRNLFQRAGNVLDKDTLEETVKNVENVPHACMNKVA